jgi:hypothetical protein
MLSEHGSQGLEQLLTYCSCSDEPVVCPPFNMASRDERQSVKNQTKERGNPRIVPMVVRRDRVEAITY